MIQLLINYYLLTSELQLNRSFQLNVHWLFHQNWIRLDWVDLNRYEMIEWIRLMNQFKVVKVRLVAVEVVEVFSCCFAAILLCGCWCCRCCWCCIVRPFELLLLFLLLFLVCEIFCAQGGRGVNAEVPH